MGAVIDYTREDFAAGEARYDLVMDIIRKSSFARARRVLKPDGRYLLVSFRMRQVRQMLWTRLRYKLCCVYCVYCVWML